MIKLLFLSCGCAWVVSGLIYIDRHTLEFDKKFTNWNLSYTTGRDRNSVNNFTLQTFTTITKILIYFTCCVAEDSNDKEYRREVVRTVIDLGKLFKGFQGNPLLKGGIENLRKGLKSEFTFPLPPVWSLKIIFELNLVLVLINNIFWLKKLFCT